MFDFFANKARAISEAVGETLEAAGEKAASIKGSVLEGIGDGASTAIEYLEKNWSSIEKVIVDGLITVTHDRIQDDEVFLAAVGKAFEFLPMPVRLILPRAAFEKHSLTHRESIVKMLEEKKASRGEAPIESQDA